jgi:hypothetical protein
MGGKRRFGQGLLRSVMALCIALYPVLSIAQDVVKKASSGKPASGTPSVSGAGQTGGPNAGAPAKIVRTAAQDKPTPKVVPKNGVGQSTFSVVVYLRVDGNLAGRVSILDSAGKRLPAKAHVSFIQRGKTLSAVDTNERGQFQVHGLQAGVYSVIASGPDGFAVIAAQVLPPAGDAPRDQLLLDLTLVPSDDADALSKLLAQTEPPEPPVAPVTEGQPIYGGGSGGGGGGGGGLGIAAMAMGGIGMGLGIGAISKDHASPSKPR